MDDTEIRWANYRRANEQHPEVRAAEREALLARLGPRTGERIAEIGAGSGFASLPIARAINPGVLYALDCEAENLMSVIRKNPGYAMVPLLHEQQHPYRLPLPDATVDAACSIATLHHHDDRSRGTGTAGRAEALEEMARVVRRGGRVVLADVAHGTPTQAYFDAIDNPRYCHPSGHPHDFLDEPQARTLCTQAGLHDITHEVVDVPWQFRSRREAADFLHVLHNARCSPEESLQVALDHLPSREQDGFTLGWQLFYLTARK